MASDTCQHPAASSSLSAGPRYERAESSVARVDGRLLSEDQLAAAAVRWYRLAARPVPPLRNTKGYSSTYLAMGFANVRAGTQKRRGLLYYRRAPYSRALAFAGVRS